MACKLSTKCLEMQRKMHKSIRVRGYYQRLKTPKLSCDHAKKRNMSKRKTFLNQTYVDSANKKHKRAKSVDSIKSDN